MDDLSPHFRPRSASFALRWEWAQALREEVSWTRLSSSIQTMDACDVLYGVTMEQPGISKLVFIELRGEKRPVPAAVEAAE